MTVRDLAADLTFSAVLVLIAWAVVVLTRWDLFYVLTSVVFGGHLLRAAIRHWRNRRDRGSEDPAPGRTDHSDAGERPRAS